MSEHFNILVDGAVATAVDENTVIVTSPKEFDDRASKLMYSAMQKYGDMQVSGVKFSESPSSVTPTVEQINEYVTGVNTSISNVLELNRIVKRFILTDDIMGATYTAVQANLNNDFRLKYGSTEGRNKRNALQKAKDLIELFNNEVKLRRVISQGILGCFTEGTYIMYLRSYPDGGVVIDTWPLGIAEISEYTMNGDPIVQINIREFESRLRKTYPKTKAGKALYFENVQKEIEANFPPEVVEAYKRKETYAKLDPSRTSVPVSYTHLRAHET